MQINVNASLIDFAPWKNNITVRARLRSDPRQEMFYEDNGRVTTYGEFMKRAGQYAYVLAYKYKIEKGDRVMARVSKTVDTVALYIACLQIGAVYIPVNTAYTEKEAAHYIKDATPTLLVSCATDIDFKFKDRLIVVDENQLSDDTNSAKEMTDIENVRFTDPASICYTSGTTGLPKGAVLTHGGLSTNAEQIVKAWGFTNKDRNLHCLPFYHVHGMYMSLHSSLFSHSALIWRKKFEVEDAIEHMKNATVMMGVPTYFSRLLSSPHFEKPVFSNMRVFISGSAPLSVATIDAFEKKTGHVILERYGMTEAQVMSTNPLHGERIPGTVGPALADIKIRIGEGDGIEIQSQSLFAGYWNNPEKTKSEFTADGWFKTGDCGTIDEKGYLRIAGRSKDLIISGGLNVYPKEIEDAIDPLPNVKESAVIASPHPDFGEAVVAIVVLKERKKKFNEKDFEKNIREILKENLAHYKIPKRVIVVEELPRNWMTKVMKNVLRDQYKNLFDSK
ncbi:unnamed protein product [Caenorhabditis auriculariae]|uniref:Malonyl-CoA synthase n=1 Tax=Caenorhabditis auriculariae TaxID=2777116 RepID=A0A8S1HDI8_9PELO|nr:unnamed protein product [Caenorhabditis auriculariae]